MTDQLEPWCELQALLREHLFQFLRGDISCVLCLVRVSFDIDIGFDEENVVNCAISQSAIGALRVVKARGSTDFRALPISHRLVLCSVSSSRTGIGQVAPGPP